MEIKRMSEEERQKYLTYFRMGMALGRMLAERKDTYSTNELVESLRQPLVGDELDSMVLGLESIAEDHRNFSDAMVNICVNHPYIGEQIAYEGGSTVHLQFKDLVNSVLLAANQDETVMENLKRVYVQSPEVKRLFETLKDVKHG